MEKTMKEGKEIGFRSVVNTLPDHIPLTLAIKIAFLTILTLGLGFLAKSLIHRA